MRDRYEGKSHGHSFGATNSGITATNRPVWESFPDKWTGAGEAFQIVKGKTGMSGRSLCACINSLVRHGLIQRPSAVDSTGGWLRKEQRKKP